jgi:hypothetical protein
MSENGGSRPRDSRPTSGAVNDGRVARRHFYVTGTMGPLRDAERVEARRWAEDLAARHIANGAMVGGPTGDE